MDQPIEKDLSTIRRELEGGEEDLSSNRLKSLKYYVRDLHSQVGRLVGRQDRHEEDRRAELNWALGVIGVVGFLLATTQSAGSDSEWISGHTVAFRLWAVVFCTIFIGVSFERSGLFRSLWAFTSTKILISVILSGVVLYSRGSAAAYVNGVFHVDPSALPITLAFTTALLFLKLVLPFVLTAALLLSLAHLAISAGWIKSVLRGKPAYDAPVYSVLVLLVSAVILYFGWNWSHDQIADSRIPEKVYLMANALDFNDTNECANVPSGRPVIFLGATQEAVLVAPYALTRFDFAGFFETSVHVPRKFDRMRCDYKSGHEGDSL